MGSKESKPENLVPLDDMFKFNQFQEFPDDMIREVCEQMDIKELTNMVLTSKKNFKLCNDILQKKISVSRERGIKYLTEHILKPPNPPDFPNLHNDKGQIVVFEREKGFFRITYESPPKSGQKPQWGLPLRVLENFVRDPVNRSQRMKMGLNHVYYLVPESSIPQLVRMLENEFKNWD